MSCPSIPIVPSLVEQGIRAPRRFVWLPSDPLLMVLAAVALGLAVHLRDGEYTPLAIVLVTAALLANVLAVTSSARSSRFNRSVHGASAVMRDGGPPRVGTMIVLVCGLMLQFGALLTAWPTTDLPHHGVWQLIRFDGGIAAAIAAAVVGAFAASRLIQKVWFPLLLALSLGLSIWIVRSAPDPPIDVFVFQQNAAAAMLKGHNPYAMTFPDIYHSTLPGHQSVYGRGLVVDGRLQFGFPYPPTSLLLATIGYVAGGDCRYAQAFAIVLAGLLIGYSRPGRTAKLAAALLLFTPRVFFVLSRGWTEPFAVMFLAAVIWCACRRSRLLPLALGLLLATKQYMVLALPLTFFLLPSGWKWRDWFGLLWKTALVALAATLPLALWNFAAFWKSAVTVQELAPFRWDALSYLVWYGFRGHRVTAPWVAGLWSGIAAVSMLALVLWRSVRSPAGFAAGLSLISLAFFAFNKQAFCNYYFFVIGAMCCAIAAEMRLDGRAPQSMAEGGCATPAGGAPFISELPRGTSCPN